jgi:hypothetical protein
MLDARCSMLDARYSMLDARCWMLDARCWMLDAGFLLGFSAEALKPNTITDLR